MNTINNYPSYVSAEDDPSRSYPEVQSVLDALAACRCPHEISNNYAAFEAMTPQERLELFHALGANTMDLVQVPVDQPQALMGDWAVQSELKNTLLTDCYDKIEVLQRNDMQRRIDISPIQNTEGSYLFSRDRVLWRCTKPASDTNNDDSTRFDYVIKRSYFIADSQFINLLHIDLNYLALSDKKTIQCENLLDHNNDLVTPYSVLYYIKAGCPDNIHPPYTAEQIRHILDLLGQPKETSAASAEQIKQTPMDTLWVGGGVNNRDVI